VPANGSQCAADGVPYGVYAVVSSLMSLFMSLFDEYPLSDDVKRMICVFVSSSGLAVPDAYCNSWAGNS
jgi:hypothetical protein